MSRARSMARDLARTCVGCRQRDVAAHLLRFVARDGRLAVDASRRLQGRGAWAHARRGCIERALKRGGFNYALRMAIHDEPERLLPEAAAVCAQEALRALGLLRRSGDVRFGRDEGLAAVRTGRAAALWLAQDAAPRTASAARRVAEEHQTPVHSMGNSRQLGQALGAAPVAVVALPSNQVGLRALEKLELWVRIGREATVYNRESGA